MSCSVCYGIRDREAWCGVEPMKCKRAVECVRADPGYFTARERIAAGIVSDFDRHRREHPVGAKAWRQMPSRRQVWPLDPRVGDFAIDDIAHELANLCRYGGACSRFYSVAEHSVYCSLFGDPRYARRRLMHDAAEAVLGIDFAGPVKRHPACAAFFARLEEPIERALFRQFDCEDGGDWKEIDWRILADERAALFEGEPPAAWWPTDAAPEPLDVTILGMRPTLAKDLFLARFSDLFPEYAGP